MRVLFFYLFSRSLIGVTFLISLLFALFCLAEFATHIHRFLTPHGPNAIDIILYYIYSFSEHLFLVIPFAFLLSSLSIYINLSQHFELVALQSSGISRTKISIPFFAMATLLCTLSLLHQGYFATYCLEKQIAFEKNFYKKQPDIKKIKSYPLKEGGILILEEHTHPCQAIFIPNSDTIYLVDHYDVLQNSGQKVTHLSRDEEGFLHKKNVYNQFFFPFTPEFKQHSYVWAILIPLTFLLAIWLTFRYGFLYERFQKPYLVIAKGMGIYLGVHLILRLLWNYSLKPI